MIRARFFTAIRDARGLLWIPLLIVVSSQLGTRLAVMREEGRAHEPAIPEREREAQFHPELYRILSMGHLQVAVDMLWIRGLQDPVVSPQQKWLYGEHPLIFYTFDLATTLDPLFFAAYTAGANLLAIVRNDSAGARDLLEKGRTFSKLHLWEMPQDFRDRFWSTPWHIPSLLTYLYFYPLKDLKKGAEAVREAASAPGAPAYLRDMDQRIEKPGGIYEVGHRLLKILISRANDTKVREELEKKEQSLFVAHFLYGINFDFREFMKKQAEYKSHTTITPELKLLFWRRFLAQPSASQWGGGDRDPWGGSLALDKDGFIATTTPFEPVFGLTGH